MVQELMCGHRERFGDVEQAEATFRAAESLDSSWPLTLMSLARYASDRGDAERGLSLVRRAGATAEHELVMLLERVQPAPRPGLGRNYPCWCGSGRKYKVFHLHREQLPLAERAAWLYQKAGAGLLEGPFGPRLIETVQARRRAWDATRPSSSWRTRTRSNPPITRLSHRVHQFSGSSQSPWVFIRPPT